MDNNGLQQFLEEYARLLAQSKEAQQVLEEAAGVYAPAPLAQRPQPPAEGPSKREPQPVKWDQLVTYPFWFIWVTLIHLVVALLTLGTLGFGTALLILLGRVIDSIIGVPLASVCACGFGALACLGTLHTIFRSYRDQLKQCPW